MKTLSLFACLCLFSLGLAHQQESEYSGVSSEEQIPEFSQELYTHDESEERMNPTVLVRTRRQSPRDLAVGLSLDHQNRKVGSLHGRFDANGSGKNGKNYHANLGAGVGSVIWRSNNKRHSVGAGAYVGQSRGSFQGFNYKSKPNYGGGLGYKFRF